MDISSYDLVVIGGGPAGSSAALAASIFGKRVAVIEREKKVGGAGINTGTIPSKTLRENALVIAGAKARALPCLTLTVAPNATLAALTHQVASVEKMIRGDWEARFDQREVHTLFGQAAFVDDHTLEISGRDGVVSRVRGDHIMIATGSSPVHPPGFDFAHTRIHDSNEILEIEVLPKQLAVVGAGVIGSEYACTFAALGVEVHLIDGRDSLMPFLDREIAKHILNGMTEAGIHIHWNEKVVSCISPENGPLTLELSSGAKLVVSDVLVASGRSSNTEILAVEKAGITLGKRGLVPVNAWFQTSVPHIYATGDVVGAPALAATSMEQARVAVCHAFDIMKKELSPILPTGIYTIPEAGTVGATEAELTTAGTPFVVGRARYRHNPRGRIIGDAHGMLKLLFHRDSKRLLGVHVVGEQATELVHVGMMAMIGEATMETFNRACFNYPSLGDLYKYAAYEAMLSGRSDSRLPASV
jgi:NAD(P) transhydrogenase